MRTQWLPALVILLLTATGAAQVPSRPKAADLSWGPNAGGLRMAVWTNPAADKIFAVVRNASRKNVCFCEPESEYPSTVYLRASSGSPWHELKPQGPFEERIVLPLCYTRTIKPGEEMPRLVPPPEGYSFAVDLRGYAVPAGMSGAVEARLVLPLIQCITGDPENNPRHPMIEVESRPVRLRLPLTGPVG